MKKIISLFKRDYDTKERLVFDEVVEGAEWVIAGEGIPTVKVDGTACMLKEGKLYKRFDRKHNRKTGEYKDAPEGWIACEDNPNEHTGHWPGWIPVGEGPEDKWHREAQVNDAECLQGDGTYELVGPKVQGNPYNLFEHHLWKHGLELTVNPRTLQEIESFLTTGNCEGIVWHHSDGRMVKIKAKDFGLKWPRQT